MSHHSQRDNGPLDAQQSAVDGSSTAGPPPHILSSPGNSNNSSHSPLSETGSYRSQRRAAPSPLQTSITANSSYSTPTPTRTFAKASLDSRSRITEARRNDPLLNGDSPRSPKERLDDLLASERTFYNPDDDPLDKVANGILPRVRPSNVTNTAVRSASDPLVLSKAIGQSPTTIKPSMATAASRHRANMAHNQPRTSSIDSAISSLSIGTKPDSPSRDAGSPDISNLIQAAGSSEAVIQHLLKEKRSQSAQNAQLWRLVDKQRAMILGLNKDLERALKDKERYRKKLKETLEQPTQNVHQSTTSVTSVDTPSPAKRPAAQQTSQVESLISAGLRESASPKDDSPASPPVSQEPNPTTSSAERVLHSARSLQNFVESEHQKPSASAQSPPRDDADAQAAATEPQQVEIEATQEVPYKASVPPSRSLPADPPPQATWQVGGIEEGLRTFPAPPRKPPPAPLTLEKPTTTSSHLHEAESVEDSDSDYDDVLEVDEIPPFTERGRRKTREEDDRVREFEAAKDAEIRSLSKKSKSRPTTPNGKATDPFQTTEAVPSIRQAVGISPPDAHVRHLSPPASLAGSLVGMLSSMNATEQTSEIISRQVISPPLMSPGLPASPRPADRGMSTPLPRNPRDGASGFPLASPPLSPRGMGAFPGVPLSPRAPRQPIPLPPNTPMSSTSSELSKNMQKSASSASLDTSRKPGESLNKIFKDDGDIDQISTEKQKLIFRGFITEEYPDLLLPPNALPSIEVRVASSRLRPSRASMMLPTKSDEDPVFTLSVFGRSDGRELWRVEKDSNSLTQLDQELHRSPNFQATVPERSLFSGHAPVKIDARRVSLDFYFDEILNTPLNQTAALQLCRYLSTNAVDPDAPDSIHSSDSVRASPVALGPGGRPSRNGYLTKRGKNFGGWKARFFVLDGPVLKYYEAPGGAHLGAIKLQHASIGKQQQQGDQGSEKDDPDNQYRHAFLILEPKRKDSSSLVRHVLCAESDKERDQWVADLMQYVDYDSDEEDGVQTAHGRKVSADSYNANRKRAYGQGKALNVPESEDELRGISYEATTPGEVPYGVNLFKSETPSPPTHGNERDTMPQATPSTKNISAPKNATLIADTGAWGNKSLAPVDDKIKQKKRSFFGFGGSKPRPSAEIEHSNESTPNLTQLSHDQHGPVRAVFGAPLAEAVRFNHPVDVDMELPAVVYRCIEYLDSKNAAAEEGIFRLSGSNIVIKQLRERFNIEGDVNLVTDDQYYDIHAVASLLKLYLRELPTTILTREYHLDFLQVTELHDTSEKVAALNGLVHKLPKANGTLLRYLSSFLINIVNHSDENKMTVRNVGIVFSPTLNIPAPVFALFLQEYEGIFDSEPEQHDPAPVEVTITAPPLTPDDIRSPRKQMFQELPTPSYNQQSFPRAPTSFSYSQPNLAAYDTGFTPLQPTYETQAQAKAQGTLGGPEYGSFAQTLAGPAYEQFGNPSAQNTSENLLQATTSKSKRRESSMLSIGFGVPKKQPSFNNKMKQDSHPVDEASF